MWRDSLDIYFFKKVQERGGKQKQGISYFKRSERSDTLNENYFTVVPSNLEKHSKITEAINGYSIKEENCETMLERQVIFVKIVLCRIIIPYPNLSVQKTE